MNRLIKAEPTPPKPGCKCVDCPNMQSCDNESMRSCEQTPVEHAVGVWTDEEGRRWLTTRLPDDVNGKYRYECLFWCKDTIDNITYRRPFRVSPANKKAVQEISCFCDSIKRWFTGKIGNHGNQN